MKIRQQMPIDDKTQAGAPHTFAQRAHALFVAGRLDEAEFCRAIAAAPERLAERAWIGRDGLASMT